MPGQDVLLGFVASDLRAVARGPRALGPGLDEYESHELVRAQLLEVMGLEPLRQLGLHPELRGELPTEATLLHVVVLCMRT